MHLFRVWAPDADTVDLVLTRPVEQRVSMFPGDNGWWAVEVEDAGHGTDYAFSLDGGPARPDPRSAWQPDGVHSSSRVFDTARHLWSDEQWRGVDVLGRVFYELHVGTFTTQGTLDAAIERLNHLVELGIDVVEVMPVAAFEGRWGWGYDGVALYAVHEPYGGPAALQRFVDACHRVGLAVCLDVVYNHLGPSGNYLSQFGPYFTDRHETPWGEAVNLDDAGRTQVRRWICDNALRWLEDFHVDCLRLDAVHSLVDESGRHVLAQLSDEVAELSHRVGRPLALVAESDLNDPTMIEPTIRGGLGMTAQWSDDFHHALHAWVTGEKHGYYTDFGGPEIVARTLTQVFRHSGDWSTFRHRDWGRPVDTRHHSGHRFLGYLQTHDQVGNRAVGDRISTDAAAGRVAAGAALVLTSPFTPMLFMGEEWAAGTPWQYFTDFDDELGALVREGRRAEFAEHGWTGDQTSPGEQSVPDPQDPQTRERSVLDWSEPAHGDHARMLAWYQSLIALRRAEPDLRDPDLSHVRVTSGADWLVVGRAEFDVLVNLGPSPVVLPTTSGAQVLLAWPGAPTPEPAPQGLRLPPDTCAVVRR